jgi:hypothetical protein
MKVRMRQFVGSYVQVRDLQPGEVVDLNPDHAEQFIANGIADPIDDEKTPELEAATLSAPRRRG